MIQLVRKPKEFVFLLCSSLLFFLLRFPSLFEPHWYGDEGIYQAIGHALNNGRTLYSTIWDNKPPLLYFIYSILDADQFAVRFLSLLFGIASLITFFYLAKKIFHSERVIFISTVVFALLFALPTFEGNIANAENFMLFPILLAAYFLIPNHIQDLTFPKRNYLLASGLLLGIAFLFKIVAIFDAVAFTVFLFLFHSPSITLLSHIKKLFKKKWLFAFIHKMVPFFGGFLLPFGVVSLLFLFQGTFVDFIQAVLTRNVEYVGHNNAYLIPQGLLLGKLLLLLLFVVLFLLRKDLFSTRSRFIILWLGFSLFNAYFSQRPYTHYILVLLPAFSLTVGLVLTLQKKYRIQLTILLICIVFLILNSFRYFSFGKTLNYYGNFVSFLQGKKDLTAYRSFFDSRTPMYYEISSYLNLHLKKNDGVFIWGDAPQLYAMTKTVPPGRYTVAYHILSSQQNINETYQAVDKTKPRFIVVLHETVGMPFFWTSYQQRITIEGATIYERTF